MKCITFYEHIGEGYEEEKNYDAALEAYVRAAKMRLRIQGPDHSDTATALYNFRRVQCCIVIDTFCKVGKMYTQQGKYPEALQMHQEVLEFRLKTFGPDHPDTAATQNNIGLVLQGQGKYPEALDMLNSALKTRVDKLGPDHLHVAGTRNNIAIIHAQQGELVAALLMWEDVLKIQVAKLGPDHLLAANTYSNIGTVYNRQGNRVQAGEMWTKAYKIRLKELGPGHPSTQALKPFTNEP